MEVKIKKLDERAVIPTYAKPCDAGMDLTVISCEYDPVKGWIYHTGLAFEVPKGHVMLLFPRSSNCKTQAYLTNSVGVIDSGYRGEVMFVYKNINPFDRNPPYTAGNRIGQAIIIPYPHIDFVEVDELSESERGEGGYGSTGK